MSEVDPNKPVRVAIDTDGYLILAGDPNYEDEDTNKELLDIIKKGHVVKTITYAEFKLLSWVWDKPKTENNELATTS